LSADVVNGVLPQTFIDGKVQNIDPLERWYPTPGIFVLVAAAQADPQSQTFADQSIAIAAKGVKSVQYQLKEIEPVWGGKIEDLACTKLGTYTVDDCGGLEGVIQNGDETKLYPKPINKASFDVNSIPADLTPQVEVVDIQYQFERTYQDRNRRYIPADAIELDLLTAWENGGLVDINPQISAQLATGFTLLANTYFGYPEPVVVSGLVAADFALAEADGTPIAITSVTPSATVPGSYVFAIPDHTGETVTLSHAQPMLDKNFDMADQAIVLP